MTEWKTLVKKSVPAFIQRPLCYMRSRDTQEDMVACIAFLRNRNLNTTFLDRLRIVNRLYAISRHVNSPHAQQEILQYIQSILSLPSSNKGVLVEVGCFKGGSTAKFSLAADIVERELVVFDSFQGIPETIEPHGKSILGGNSSFKRGDYCATLDEVKANVAQFGVIKRCRFIPGWVEDTLPRFNEAVSAIYLDVDLASATRTCLKYLFPLLENGGVLYSHDCHLPLVIDVFNNEEFWVKEVGCRRPRVQGLGERELVKITKDN
jgi:O-methyltransferase